MRPHFGRGVCGGVSIAARVCLRFVRRSRYNSVVPVHTRYGGNTVSRIYFDPIRADDGEPCVRATIIAYDERGDERARLSHVMTIVGAGIRMDDFAAMLACAKSGDFVDDTITAASILGESNPTGRML